MPLQKTSIQINSQTREQLEKLYPNLSISDIIRLSMEYTLRRKPRLILQASQFEETEEEKKEIEPLHVRCTIHGAGVMTNTNTVEANKGIVRVSCGCTWNFLTGEWTLPQPIGATSK